MLLKIIKAFCYSIEGFKGAYKKDQSFKIEAILSIPLILYILIKNIVLYKKLILLGTIVIVLSAELFNTAIEKSIDAFEKQHPLFKLAKDCGSAAVALLIGFSILVWVAFLWMM